MLTTSSVGRMSSTVDVKRTFLRGRETLGTPEGCDGECRRGREIDDRKMQSR
jgi:hypothetical protein